MKKTLIFLPKNRIFIQTFLFFFLTFFTHLATAQNWNQIIKAAASDRLTKNSGVRHSVDNYGYSVAVDGNYAIVGAFGEGEDSSENNSLNQSGSAFILYNNAGTWVQIKKLTAGTRATIDRFGFSVSISGSYAIVGAYQEDEDASEANTLSGSGSAYIFKKDQGGTDNWGQIKKITASTRGVSDDFGWSVAISGSYAIVGARNEDEDATEANTLSASGSAYIFKQDQGGTDNWGQIKKITASTRAAGDNFGNSVAISGSYVIVGAPFESEDASEANTLTASGSAYIFKQDQGGTDNWGQIKKITASTRGAGDNFGNAVAISGSYVIVGAPSESEDASEANTLTASGSAYIFKQDQGGTDNWGQIKKVTASTRGASDQFGYSVAINGSYAILGAFAEDEDASEANTLSASGSAYIFKQDQGGTDNWGQIKKITASTRAADDNFGNSVAISGSYAIVGAYLEDEDSSEANTLSASGSAYVFKQDQGGTDNWGQMQKAVMIGRIPDDNYGVRVAIDGNYAIVAAHADDEDASGNNYLLNAGSAYILKNTNGIWTQIKKITASIRGANDYFGFFVAISGSYAIVGAPYDDQDSSEANTLSNSGSVYIFKKDQGGTDNWGQIKKITASSRAVDDNFGHSVAISGSYVIVGAPYEDEDASESNNRYNSGSAYIFKQDQGGSDNWGQIKKITASTRSMNDWFGFAVAINGSYAIVGAISEDEDASEANYLAESGSAYIFKQDQGGTDNWGQIKKITASTRGASDQFGWSIAINGSYAIVSAKYDDEDSSEANTLSASGSAYIFKQDQGGTDNWGQIKKITASTRGIGDFFGHSVAIRGSYAIVGAFSEDEDTSETNTLSTSGSAYIYKQDHGGSDNWGQIKKITASTRAQEDYFGISVAISDSYAIVGAYDEDEDASESNTLTNSGSAYIFHNGALAVPTPKICDIVTTLAGSTTSGFADGTGSAARFNGLLGFAIDPNDTMYVTEELGNRIRKITPNGIVTTLAGNGTAGGANGTGASATFNHPAAIALDNSGNLYVTDYGGHTVRKITPAGVVTAFVGTYGVTGTTDASGAAARFFHPQQIVIDASNTYLYVCDMNNHRIRKIAIVTGAVTTLAGSASGFADATGTSAKFNSPVGLVIDADTLYVADWLNHRIRKVVVTTGVVTTVAGDGTAGFANGTGTGARFNEPNGIEVDAAHNLYVSEVKNHMIRKITPAGVVTTIAGSTVGYKNGASTSAKFNFVRDLAFDSKGNLIMTENGNHAIRKMGCLDECAATGNLPTTADSTYTGLYSYTDANSWTHYCAEGGELLLSLDTSASGALVNADEVELKLGAKTTYGYLGVDGGMVNTGNQGYQMIDRRWNVSPTTQPTIGKTVGVKYYFTNQEYLDVKDSLLLHGPGQNAANKSTITAVTNINLYKATTGSAFAAPHTVNGIVLANGAAPSNTIWKYAALDSNHSATFEVSSFDGGGGAGAGGGNESLAGPTPKICDIVTTLAGSTTSGFADGTGSAARFNGLLGFVIDPNDTMYVTELGNRIRKITPNGVVTTLAGNGTAGGANGTGASATFNNPAGIVLDNSGNLYVTDYDGHTVRKITPAGVVTAFVGTYGATGTTDASGAAARFFHPQQIVIDASNTYLYVCDMNNHRIRKIAIATGAVTTLAGSTIGFADATGTSAKFNSPVGLVIDADTLYVADWLNHRIRKVVVTTGVVTTVAGDGTAGFVNGTGTGARFNEPNGIEVDAAHNLYVSEVKNHMIRKITPAGVVTTIAGSTVGYKNGASTSAKFNFVRDLAFDSKGNLIMTENGNHAVRKMGCLDECGFTRILPTTSDSTFTGLYSYTDANSWTHYCAEGGELLLSLDTGGSGALVNADEVELKLGAKTTYGYLGADGGMVSTGNQGYQMIDRRWNVSPTTQPSTGTVGIKYYFTNQEYLDVKDSLLLHGPGQNAAYKSSLSAVTNIDLYKATTGSAFADPHTVSGIVIANGNSPSTTEWVYAASANSNHSAEFKVSSFSGGGGGGGGGGGAGPGPLPVELIHFTAKALTTTSAQLNWATAIELNNSHFVIERSLDGKVFNTLGSVAGNGTSNDLHNYGFTDPTIEVGTKKAFYRLKQVDYNGQWEYSEIRVVNFSPEQLNTKNSISVYPNPFTSDVYFDLGKVENNVSITVIDLNGRSMLNTTLLGAGLQKLDLSSLSDGLYILSIASEHDIQQVRIMKK